MSDALALGLTSFHCPIYNDWQSNSNLTNSMDSIHSSNNLIGTGTGTNIVTGGGTNIGMDTGTNTGTGMVPLDLITTGTLKKQFIINHLWYAHLFSGIGHFRCNPVHIMMKPNTTPVQKPP